MVIGWLQQEQEDGLQTSASAWARVEAAQSQRRLPCLLVPQPAHAVLAGELAAGLTCFGELPPEIIRAIQMHDTGWAASDAQQIQRLRSGGAQASHAVSFIAIPPREAEEAWTASINTVEAFSKTGAMIISRHFTLLAGHDPVAPAFSRRRRRRASESSHAQRTSRRISPAGPQPWASATWSRFTCCAG